MDALTEEQRRRIEMNRQRALERNKHRRGRQHDQPLFNGNTARNISTATPAGCNFHSQDNCTNTGNFQNALENVTRSASSDIPSTRESFGDSKIDWADAVNMMDRIVATSRENSNSQKSSTLENKKRKMENENNGCNNVPCKETQHSHDGNVSDKNQSNIDVQGQNTTELTNEQRSRIESNRRKALEKKKIENYSSIQLEMANTCSKFPSEAPQLSSSGLSAIHVLQPANAIEQNNKTQLLTEEQRARTENNRRKALEKKTFENGAATLLMSSNASRNIPPEALQQVFSSTELTSSGQSIHAEPINASSMHESDAPKQSKNAKTLTEEQRLRIENNRRKALEKKQKKCAVSTLPNDECKLAVAKTPCGEIQPMLTISTNINNKKEAAEQFEVKESATPIPNETTSTENIHHADVTAQNGIGANDNFGHNESKKVCQLTDEQRARMEQNRLQAIEKRKTANTVVSTKDSPSCHNDTVVCKKDDTHNVLPDTQLKERSTASEVDCTEPTSPQKEAEDENSDLPKIPPDLHYDIARCLPVDDGNLDSLIENAELDKPLLNDWTLFKHQKEGVIQALKMRRLILAFDMGLGKTIIGCVWAKAFLKTFDGVKIFVIAPVSLHQEWKNIARAATGLKVDSGKKKKGKKRKKPKKPKTPPDGDSDDDDGCDADDDDCSPPALDLHVFSWSNISAYKKVIQDISEYVVVCDEAHSMQSMESKRTEEVMKLVFPKRCRGLLLLSGTPMKNGRPSNLFPLLKAVKHPFGDNQKRFEFFFCNGQHRTLQRGTIWDASGSSNLKELNAHTASHIFRKTKEECMSKELPPKKREPHKIVVSSLHELRYSQALKDLARAFTLSRSAENGGDKDDILTPFNKLRQISSIAKVDAAVALANLILKDESSLVIFTSFVAVAKDLYQKLDAMGWTGEILTGETVPHKRQMMVDNFQSEISPVFICTYGAGGVGLTLTAACTVLLVDRPWTPGDVCQAEDRVRRIGQTRPVRSIWVKAFPIDDQIDELLDHKEAKSNIAVDGKELKDNNNSAPKVSISKLVKSVLEKQGMAG